MRVLLIGAGGIGRRHAQSLVTSKHVDVLNIVDPSRKALRETAKMLIESDKRVNYHTKCNANGTHDVAIIATSANDRHAATKLVKDKCKYLILEKFLFNKVDEYRIDLSKNIAYVNCPRRAMKCFDQFKEGTPTIFYYGMTNILSNTIHMADLLCYLSKSEVVKYDIEISKTRKTKRRGYHDIDGRVIINTADDKRGSGMAYLTTATTKDAKYDMIINDMAVDEERRMLLHRDGREEPFKFKYQSELTASYIDDIVKDGTCKLASFDQSAQWHLSLIDTLRRKGWSRSIT